jgi:1-acyl-sn-glycerol-3-phosphate acyltransferase
MSDGQPNATVEALGALDAARWRVLNLAQAAFLIFWTAFLTAPALLSLAVTFSTRVPLWMARRVWAPPLLRAGGVRLDVRGTEKLADVGSCMIMSNHQSMLDIAVVFAALPKNLRFVAKRVLFFVPFLGWYMWGMGMIPVDRKNRAQAVRALKRAIELFDGSGGANIMTFPEGTRTRDGRVMPFKKGLFMLAIESGVPIVPIAIEGAYNVLPSDGFSVRPGTVKLAVGDAIPTAGLTVDDRDALIQRVRDAVIDLNAELGGAGGDKSTPVA